MNSLKINCIFSSSFLDYPDNESQCVIVYVLGCNNKCQDCHSENLTNPNYKSDDSLILNLEEFIDKVKKNLKDIKTRKLTLSGGDPLFINNIEFVKRFLEKIENDIDVCIYTGHSIDYVKKNKVYGFTFIKCGKYDFQLKQESLKTDQYIQFSSKNQKLYNKEFNLLSKNGRFCF